MVSRRAQGRTAMMGYTENDIEKFQEVLLNIYTTGTCNTKQAETIKEIQVFFEGLIAEGRL
jgi:hypothetical protein